MFAGPDCLILGSVDSYGHLIVSQLDPSSKGTCSLYFLLHDAIVNFNQDFRGVFIQYFLCSHLNLSVAFMALLLCQLFTKGRKDRGLFVYLAFFFFFFFNNFTPFPNFFFAYIHCLTQKQEKKTLVVTLGRISLLITGSKHW